MAFDYSLDFEKTNFRENPELYRVGRGEQGVLSVEPYKSEILPYWKFRTPDIARDSANTIFNLFLEYKTKGDFVGMDMARKFLQMGYTRARRYANHKSGRKYADKESKEAGKVLPRTEDPVKAESAKIFYEQYLKAKSDEVYLNAKKQHQEAYEKT